MRFWIGPKSGMKLGKHPKITFIFRDDLFSFGGRTEFLADSLEHLASSLARQLATDSFFI
jgi:hypothetical protein